MRKIHEVLRLKWAARLSYRQIAQSLGIAHSTVADYLRRAEEAGLSWPLPEALDPNALERLLFKQQARPTKPRPVPDWEVVHRELRRKGVTLRLLWEEYRSAQAGDAGPVAAQSGPECSTTRGADGSCYSYTRFCQLYRAWAETVDVVMRQSHAPGEKLFVDFAGQTVPIVDPLSGLESRAQIFVAVLGASNYTFVWATPSQDLRSWVEAHQRAFAFYGGCPRVVVTDNLKPAVTRPHSHEPELNRTYLDMAEHYGVAIIPARVRRPRDKAKVEKSVQIAENWILARLRDRTFFSIGELAEAIEPLLVELNLRPFQKLPGSRRSVFEELERPTLQPLPESPYVFAKWLKRRARLDYHVEVDHHYYSVPFQFAKNVIDVRLTASTVECFLGGRRLASHARSAQRGGYTTVKEHMPPAHRRYAGWTPEHIEREATKIGPATLELTRQVIASRRHPEQGYRSCMGILKLEQAYGAERLEAAARRALAIGARSSKSVTSILKHGLENLPLPDVPPELDLPIEHDNIRGALYYAERSFGNNLLRRN